MELNITRFFREAAPMDYSASRAEIGDDAGASTWQAAMDDAGEWLLLESEDALQEFRDYIKGFGAWDDEDIAAMSGQELNALCIQLIAGDIRAVGLFADATAEDWEDYEARNAAGECGGQLYGAANGEVFYCIG